jgi:hypothetical protein
MSVVGRWHVVGFAGVFIALAPVAARAQYQVDTGVGQVDNRVGGELYGNNSSNVRYPVPGHFRLLPSEERYARWRSGALPSEIEMNRAAIGPLSPNGELDYIPQQSALQQAMGLPVPRLYNHAYDWQIIRARQAGYRFAARPGYPQNARDGVAATTFKPGLPPSVQQQNRRPGAAQQQQYQQQQDQQALRPGQLPPPTTLQGAPDRPLPTGQLYDDVKNTPYGTPGAEWLSKLPTIKRPDKIDSLGDPKK